MPSAPSSSRAPTRFVLVAAAALLSGAAGLVDEVVWIRRSALAAGSTTFALSTVLAVFFLGLAIGGWWFGGLSRRVRDPLRACAALEAALAVLVLATVPAFGLVEMGHGLLARALTPDSPLRLPGAFALVAIVLLPPSILMGGSLPLLTRPWARDPGRLGGAIAGLYALHTLGAAIGCAVAGFVLIPAIGLRLSLVVAAGSNLATAALLLAARVPASAPSDDAGREGLAPAGVRARVALLLFATGFVALGAEVLWTRFLALVVRSTTHTATLTLLAVLLGIAIGSAIVSRLPDRRVASATLFGGLQLTTGVLVWTMAMLPSSFWLALGGQAAVIALLLLVPAILSGASFPIAVRLVVASPAWAGVGLGTMSAANTLGGIAGALAMGFAILPGLGLEAGLRTCALTSVAAGSFACIGLGPARGRGWAVAASAAAAAFVFLLPAFTRTRLPADYLAVGATLIEAREGQESNLAVVRRSPEVLRLEIDRWWQGQDRRTHQVMAAHLPLMLHPRPRRVLVIGAGAGQTPERVTWYPVEAIDCVDIEPRVFDLIESHFASAWMRDPRVRLLRADGRHHVATAADRYDVISIEVGQVFRPGVATFYTADFYGRARARLEPDGVISQFLPLPFFTPDELRSVVASFLAAFPEATLWYNTSELLLVGGADAAPSLDRARVEAVLAHSRVAADLQYSLWGGPAEWLARPEVLIGGFLCGPAGLRSLASGAPPYRDDRPALEYSAAVVANPRGHEAETLPLLEAHLDSIANAGSGWDAATLGAAGRMRERNLSDIRASAILRQADEARARGEHAAGVVALERALAVNPRNLRAQRLLGEAHLLLGRAEPAAAAFDRALAIDPGDRDAHFGLGVSLHRLGRVAEAVTRYERATELGLDNAQLHNHHGAALGTLGDLEGAAREFQRAIALRPDDGEAHQNLARVRAAMRADTAGRGVP
jgi:spermidine synthase